MTASVPFAINGRFLGQPQTGVQRYALNTVKAIGEALGAGARPRLLAPRSTSSEALDAQKFEIIAAGPLSGHLWEQCTLPFLAEGRLLNLCNTAPIAKSNQVVCIHDANVFTMPESYGRAFREYYRSLQPLIARRSAAVATVSQSSARQIARHLQIPLDSIAVLYNGHEHALDWNPERGQEAQRFYAQHFGSGTRGYVLALGSRAKHKNIDRLISIAPALDTRGLDIVVVGGNAGIFRPGDLSRASNVKHLVGVTDDDLAFLFDNALCLAFPSLTEGFGLPVVEAMARGLPVVSSNLASLPEVCGDAALMASPFDAWAWLHQIDRLRSAPDLRAELSEKGRLQAKAFSWKETAAGYLDLLERPGAIRKASRRTKEPALSVSVVIATRGRPSIVSRTVRHLLSEQTLKPQAIIVSCGDMTDAGDLMNVEGVKILTGPPGLAAQRNTGLKALPEPTDVVVFFDDDFVAHRSWLEAAARVFQDENQVAGLTGSVLLDGIIGPGLSFEEAVTAIKGADHVEARALIQPFSPYGCNMAFRMASIGRLKFDERLVLYGWLEDRDFGASVARNGGRLVKCIDAMGVHMGSKSGRVSGVRLGYSQVVNPIYMFNKGTMSFSGAGAQIFRNVYSNLTRSIRPEPYIDRRGRLKGNVIAFFDVLRGCLKPEKAAALSANQQIVNLKAAEKQT